VIVSLDDYWRELVTVAMLGTDRRDPPDAPPGPVADLVDDVLRPDGASRMLAAVAAVAAARRAGFTPRPTVSPLQPPAHDHRPMCSTDAVTTWRRLIAEWPVLEDEWVLTVVEQGLRLAPDALVELLARHRGDGVRHARVLSAAGPAASWVIDHFPELARSSTREVSVESVVSLPTLPIPPELAELVSVDAHTFSTQLAAGFASRGFGPPDRAVLVNLIARCRPAVLLDAAESLERTHVGLALALADMARLRHRMLTELGVTP
jgi:hypothetical protein